MPEGPDFYDSMTALYANETEGVNFIREWYQHRARYASLKNYKDQNKVFIMAPHGGSIESGTTELALATAGFVKNFNGDTDTSVTHNYFIFNGTNPKDQNGKLHVTSSHYDDVDANELVSNSLISFAFHGCTDEQPDESTGQGYQACLIGGRDQVLKEILEAQLKNVGFNAYAIRGTEALHIATGATITMFLTTGSSAPRTAISSSRSAATTESEPWVAMTR